MKYIKIFDLINIHFHFNKLNWFKSKIEEYNEEFYPNITYSVNLGVKSPISTQSIISIIKNVQEVRIRILNYSLGNMNKTYRI